MAIVIEHLELTEDDREVTELEYWAASLLASSVTPPYARNVPFQVTVQPGTAPASSACGCRPPQRRYHLKDALFHHLATIINNFLQNEAIQNQLRSFFDSANDLFTHQAKSLDYDLAV